MEMSVIKLKGWYTKDFQGFEVIKMAKYIYEKIL